MKMVVSKSLADVWEITKTVTLLVVEGYRKASTVNSKANRVP